MKTQHRNILTQKERQSRLIKASKDYMKGNLSRSQFQEAERKYGTDYESVTLKLASKNSLLEKIKELFSVVMKSQEIGKPPNDENNT